MTMTMMSRADALDLVRQYVGEHADLASIDRDDSASADQIGAFLRASIRGDLAQQAVEQLDEYVDDRRHDGYLYELRTLPGEVLDAIETRGLGDEVQELIYDLDHGDPISDLIGNFGNGLLLCKLGDKDANADEPHVAQAYGSNDMAYLERMEEAQRTTIRQVLDLHGMDVDLPSNAAAIGSLVDENLYHGGCIYVLWYGPVAELTQLALDAHHGNSDGAARTVTFTNPHILVWNAYAGAGFEEQFEGEITVDYDPDRFCLDGHGTGWPVDSCFGFHLPALAADPTITTHDHKEG